MDKHASLSVGSRLSRRGFCKLAGGMAACMALAGPLSSCSAPSNQSSSNSSSTARIGTLATEDFLPMWVAEQDNLFNELGVSATLTTFQSAQELSTAIAAGEIDLAMTDVQVASSLTAGGTPMTLEWVTLGADATQGRFGIMTAPSTGITSLTELAGVPIAVGSNTVPEYVMDRLMMAAGVPEDQIVSEEVKKLPVRFEMMCNAQVKAASLPASLLALGEARGMVLLADDTMGENISQSVMAARTAWADANPTVLSKLQDVWNKAVNRINANSEAYRALLVAKANLSAEVADTYPISIYPVAAKPTADMVNPVVDWMKKKGYLTGTVTYDSNSGNLGAQK